MITASGMLMKYTRDLCGRAVWDVGTVIGFERHLPSRKPEQKPNPNPALKMTG